MPLLTSASWTHQHALSCHPQWRHCLSPRHFIVDIFSNIVECCRAFLLLDTSVVRHSQWRQCLGNRHSIDITISGKTFHYPTYLLLDFRSRHVGFHESHNGSHVVLFARRLDLGHNLCVVYNTGVGNRLSLASRFVNELSFCRLSLLMLLLLRLRLPPYAGLAFCTDLSFFNDLSFRRLSLCKE